MAKTTKKSKLEAADPAYDLAEALGSKHQAARAGMQQHRATWEDKESMLLLKNMDSLAAEYRSSVNDGRLSTIVWERTSRVMAQIPTGQVRALTKKDTGKSSLMDLALWRYIVPNANSGGNHLTKLRQWNFYSALYGTMPMLYFWRVSDTYVGPDCQLIPIRNFYPQPGRPSIEDSDWCIVSSNMSVGELKRLAQDETDTWDKDGLNKVITRAEKGGKGQKSSDQQSLIEKERTGQVAGEKGDFASVEVMTLYEAGDDGNWVSFCPDYENIVIRDTPNPHGDGKIPVILKQCFPLVDSIMGLGDFERGKTLQFAMNSVVNLFMDTMKMQLYRPIIVDATNVVASSFKMQPGAIWRTKVAPSSAVQEMQFSPNGLNTFQSTYSFLSGALQNQNGTTTTEVSSNDSADPAFGKTPEALKMTGQRQSTRDDWDRFMMENAVSQLYEAFCNLMAKNHTQGADAIFHIFDEEVKKISETADSSDVKEAFTQYDSGKAGEVSLKSGALKGTQYRFLIDTGSTKKEDQKEALNNLSQLMSVLPNLGDHLTEIGEKVNWGELIKQFIIASGIDGWDKIVVSDAQAAQNAQQKQQDPIKLLEAVNFKVEKLPAPIQQALYQQMGEKFGVDFSQASQAPTPDELKLMIEKGKLDLAKQKQGFAETQGAHQAALSTHQAGINEQTANMAVQNHLASGPLPGLAEPVHPLVSQMDQIAGFNKQNQIQDPQVAELASQFGKGGGQPNQPPQQQNQGGPNG